MTDITLAVLDMAGTTVADDGLVEEAFGLAYDAEPALAGYGSRAAVVEYARATMGQSKIAVFRELTEAQDAAERANAAFERGYESLVAGGGASAIPGAEQAIRALRDEGVAVVLTTGFAQSTQRALIDALGWHDLVDLALAPVDAGGRGRPFPDLNLTALIRTRTEAVQRMLVAGDTVSDMRSGVRSGAGRVIGVRSGAHGEAQLREAGATDVLGSVAELPALLGL